MVPDSSRISVLRNGNSNGLNGWMPLGGQTPPTGNRLEAKNAQKNADEEHHLRGDEQRHAVAQADLHDRSVVALEGRLADHVAPPHGHGAQHQDERR